MSESLLLHLLRPWLGGSDLWNLSMNVVLLLVYYFISIGGVSGFYLTFFTLTSLLQRSGNQCGEFVAEDALITYSWCKAFRWYIPNWRSHQWVGLGPTGSTMKWTYIKTELVTWLHKPWFWLAEYRGVLTPEMSFSSEPMSYSPWKVWLFTFPQNAIALVNGHSSLWRKIHSTNVCHVAWPFL